MPTYSITAPNGKTLEVTGDHVPSESELKDIFAAAGVATDAASEGSATSRFIGGVAKTLNPVTMVEGAYNAVRHPLDTAGSILQDNLQQLKQAGSDFQQGRYSEAVGHGAAGLLPVIGPAAARAGERIGSGDVAGGLGEGAGLLAPFAAGPAMKAAGAGARGAVAAARAVPAGADAMDAVAALADRASTNRIVDVGGPKVGGNVKIRLNNKLADIAPQLARDPDLSALSRQGLQAKVAAKLEEATANLDGASDSRLVSQQVKTAPLVAALDAKIADLTASPAEGTAISRQPITVNGKPATTWTNPDGPIGQKVEPGPNRAQIDTLKKIRDEVSGLGPVAPYESVRRIRQAWDQVAKVKYSPAMSPDFLAKQGEATAAMKGTGAIRDALSAADPQTATANAQYSLYKTANDVLQATEETERARPRVLRGIVARTGGAMVGAESGGMVGAGVGVLLGSVVERAAELAPTAKIVIARQLASVADLLRGGQGQQASDVLRSLARRLPAKVAGPMGQETNGGSSQVPQEPRAANR